MLHQSDFFWGKSAFSIASAKRSLGVCVKCAVTGISTLPMFCVLSQITSDTDVMLYFIKLYGLLFVMSVIYSRGKEDKRDKKSTTSNQETRREREEGERRKREEERRKREDDRKRKEEERRKKEEEKKKKEEERKKQEEEEKQRLAERKKEEERKRQEDEQVGKSKCSLCQICIEMGRVLSSISCFYFRFATCVLRLQMMAVQVAALSRPFRRS